MNEVNLAYESNVWLIGACREFSWFFLSNLLYNVIPAWFPCVHRTDLQWPSRNPFHTLYLQTI